MSAGETVDLSDLSVVIPFRYDSPSRIENLSAIVDFFTRKSDGAEIILIENGSRAHANIFAGRPGVRYEFEPSDGVFHRTRMLNRGIEALSSRRFVSAYDADVLAYPEALRAAMESLRGGEKAIIPYNGCSFDVRGAARAALIATMDFSMLPPKTMIASPRDIGRDLTLMNHASVGGAPLFDRGDLLACGGYNENFISWGKEDKELVERLTKLGRRFARIADFPLLHLSHARGRDSTARNPFFRRNARIYREIEALDRAGLERLVASGGTRHTGAPPEPSLLWRTLARLSEGFRRS